MSVSRCYTVIYGEVNANRYTHAGSRFRGSVTGVGYDVTAYTVYKIRCNTHRANISNTSESLTCHMFIRN